jgi:acetyl-CoA acetyltransferase
MPELPIKDKTAIAGIGWSAFSKNSGTTVLNLAAEASLMAINDAGLKPTDIDGIVTYYWRPDTIGPRDMAEAMGIERVNFELLTQGGGGWASAAVMSAALAVYSGVCKNVLVYRAMNGRSQRRPTRAAAGGGAEGPMQFTSPYGNMHAAASFGHYATAHMARFGTSTLDFAHLAVTQRKHASLNKKAMMRELITIDDHQNSRWVVYPFRLLDCCLDSDNAVALVVTSSERAKDMKQHPVQIMSMMGGCEPFPNNYTTYGAIAAPQLYEGAGITPKDVDVAELYDPFSMMVMLHMEDFGLVPKGEVGAWVREGRNALDGGGTPVNTHGGLLSEAYVQGLNHVIEAVQQLRPGGVVDDLCQGAHTYDRSTCRQVRDAKIALTCGEGGQSSLLLRRA